jgi:xylan 1,4-beta-xylosidase
MLFSSETSPSNVTGDASPLLQAADTYQNPVIAGFFPDPSIVRVGDDFYLVSSTFQYFPAIIISHSRDLVNWRQIGHVFTRSEDLDLRGFDDGCGMWAPDISYHDGEFYVFYCLVQLTQDRSVNVRGNYMVKARDILGPWSKPVQLTTEGNDPSHFVDDDGSHYMLYAAGIPRGRGTKIVKLSDDCSRVVEGPFWMEFDPEKRAPEGPHLIKKDGYYYYTLAAGDGIYRGHHQLMARSRYLLGPYEPSPHGPFIVERHPEAAHYHHGHAKLVQTQQGEWWAVYLFRRRIGGASPLGRETGLDRVDWREDGWPVLNFGQGPSVEKTAAPAGLCADSVCVAKNGPGGGRDDFDRKQLGVEWQFVRNPDQKGFSLDARPGFLRLLGSAAGLESFAARNIVVQRERSHRYTATTWVDFNPVGEAEAGLVCYYDTKDFITLALTGDCGRCVRLSECRRGEKCVVAECSLVDAHGIYLRVQVEGQRRSFYCSYEGQRWLAVGAVDDSSFLSDEGTPSWGFTGTMVGVFAVRGPEGQAVQADFDWFEHTWAE